MKGPPSVLIELSEKALEAYLIPSEEEIGVTLLISIAG